MTIQFPDTPSQGDTFEASNGVFYTYDSGGWTANNPSGLEDRFVNVAGDTMTGTLGIGRTAAVPNITLNADGLGEFKGGVKITGGDASGVDELAGFSVDNSSAVGNNKNYGFVSSIDSDGDKNYNFYAPGTAPNFFAGPTSFTNLLDLDELLFTTTESGVAFRKTTQRFARCGDSGDNPGVWMNRVSSGTKPKYITFLIGQGNKSKIEIGFIRQNDTSASANGIEYCTDSKGTPAFVELGDARNRTFTEFTGNAVDTIKLLQPKVNGFNPAELQAVVSNAVVGTANETEEIGTLADYDGTVLETAVTEPSAEELTYTEDVEVDGVSTATVRTKSWTATGTQPVYQGVDQTKLIPLLTKALQESIIRIEDLEAKVQSLEGYN